MSLEKNRFSGPNRPQFPPTSPPNPDDYPLISNRPAVPYDQEIIKAIEKKRGVLQVQSFPDFLQKLRDRRWWKLRSEGSPHYGNINVDPASIINSVINTSGRWSVKPGDLVNLTLQTIRYASNQELQHTPSGLYIATLNQLTQYLHLLAFTFSGEQELHVVYSPQGHELRGKRYDTMQIITQPSKTDEENGYAYASVNFASALVPKLTGLSRKK